MENCYQSVDLTNFYTEALFCSPEKVYDNYQHCIRIPVRHAARTPGAFLDLKMPDGDGGTENFDLKRKV